MTAVQTQKTVTEVWLQGLLETAEELVSTVKLAQKTSSTCSSEVVEMPLVLEGSKVSAVVVPVSFQSLSWHQFTLAHWLYEAVFTFGGNGFQTFTRGGQGGNAANGQPAEPRSILVQLLPLLILFGFSLLSSLPSLFATPPTPDPHFAYNPTTKYNTEMETGGLGVHYFVNKGEFAGHPTIGAEMAREGVKIGRVLEEVITEDKDSNSKDSKNTKDSKDSKSKPKTRQVVRGKGKQRGPALARFEDAVDRIYTQDLMHNCRSNIDRKERAKEAEIGVFGFGTDWEKVKRIDAEVIESCEELKRLGVLSR